tara:strand:+ start:7921 stop:8271 length:351 start_codon:yes stop_codon:yes gene_type:complete
MRQHLKMGWWEFHKENPHIYLLFEKFALDVARHRERYSAKAIIERMRWHYNFEVNGDYEFKLTNSFTAYYARYFLHKHPELKGFFVLKGDNTKDECNDSNQREDQSIPTAECNRLL